MLVHQVFPRRIEDTTYYFPGESLGGLPRFDTGFVTKLDGGIIIMGSCPFEVECDAANDTVADPLSNFTVDCNLVEIEGLPRNVDAYRYQDKGSGYFGPCFKHTLSAYVDSATDDRGICYVWAVSNTLDDGATWTSDRAEALGLFLIKQGSNYQLRLRNHESYVTDILYISANTEYRIVINRDYGKVTADVYTLADAHVGTLMVPVLENRAYRYFYRVNSYNSSIYRTAEFVGCVNCFAEHFVCFGHGGIAFGGAAGAFCDTWGYEGRGGIALGGSAVAGIINVAYEGDGGIGLGGQGDAALPHEGSGGIAFGGSADSAITSFNFEAEGGIALGGAAGVGVTDVALEGSGGIALGGQGDAALPYEGSGGIAFGGSAETNFDIIVDLPMEWNIVSLFDAELTSLWDIESDVRFWFRIESLCLPPECDWTDTNWNDPKCYGPAAHIQGQPIESGNKYIQILPARSVRNLCELISSSYNPLGVPNFNWRIKSITRFNMTMNKSDMPDGELPDCITLEEEDFCDIPECMEYCLETPNVPNVNIGVHTEIIDTFHEFTGTGGIAFGGAAEYSGGNFFEYVAQGGLVFGGSASVISPSYQYEAEGGLELGGSAATASEYHSYEAEGGIAFGGGCVELPEYHYEGSGGIGLGGSIDSETDWGLLDMVEIGATAELLSFGGQLRILRHRSNWFDNRRHGSDRSL